MTDPKYVRPRYLDPDNPKSGKKDFYRSPILTEFDKHYTRKARWFSAPVQPLIELLHLRLVKLRHQMAVSVEWGLGLLER